MTKFFLPKAKDQKGHFFRNKKKIVKTSCNQSLHKMIFAFLQKLRTRQMQKTIRKTKQSKTAHKQNLDKYIEQLKSLNKSDLKQLGYFILKNQMNVEEENLQITLKIQKQQAKIQEKEFNQALKQFYKAIKNRQAYKKQIIQIQKKKTEVKDKKKIKKQRMKMKKKTKLTTKKLYNQGQSDKIDNQSEKDSDQNIISQDISQSLPKDYIPQESQQKVDYKLKIIKQQKKVITQFKKTGRNKFLFEKKNKTFNKNVDRNQKSNNGQKRVQRQKMPGRYETPHPSWQAKRQIKNQMFIQPFQGKKIML